MHRWYIMFPGDVYALGPIEAANEQAARRWAREWAGLAKLPAGTQLWMEDR